MRFVHRANPHAAKQHQLRRYRQEFPQRLVPNGPRLLRAILPGERDLEYTAAIVGAAFGDAELQKLQSVGNDVLWLDAESEPGKLAELLLINPLGIALTKITEEAIQ